MIPEKKGQRFNSRPWKCLTGQLAMSSVLFFLLLAVYGCVPWAFPPRMTWDLRQGHSKKDVHWQGQGDVSQVTNIDITILFPGGYTFTGQQVNILLTSCRDQDQVWDMEIEFAPGMTIDEAYRQGQQLAKQWHLQGANLDDWYQGVLENRRHGMKDVNEAFNAAFGGHALTPDGLTPFGRIINSFDDERPALLVLDFQWIHTIQICQTA